METQDDKLEWQTRDQMPSPTNALQELVEILSRTSRDCSEDKMIACMYGIICGWDDEAYKELQEQHGWGDDVVEHQKMLHKNYNQAWRLFMDQYAAKIPPTE